MPDVVIYGDAPAALANAVRAALAARNIRADVGTTIPTGRSPVGNSVPLVVVVGDVPPTVGRGGANLRQPVRLLAWAPIRDDALDLVTLVHGIALAHRDTVVRSVSYAVGPYVDADPDTGEPMGSATVTANVNPTPA